ncbi:MAG: alanyl-tRNA editing protein [Firmicutes bacterium]|nr:alanyl-tRNA editing protein [Bacillota bacterium]
MAVLAETIFYPAGGGQPCDTGFINGQPVLDVFEEEGVIYHRLAKKPQGEEALCILDWERRFDHMQQHSGQHLLSAICQDGYGYSTESFHLGAEYCSIDLNTPALKQEELLEIEEKVNDLILENIPLRTYFVTGEELKNMPVRKIPDLEEQQIRIVEIEGLDYSLCSGTHAEATGQIALFKIIKAEKYKGMSRLYFLCGRRALQDYRRKQELSAGLVALLSLPENELLARISEELEQKRDLEKTVFNLQKELLAYQAQTLAAGDSKSPLMIKFSEDSIELARQLAAEILRLGTFSIVITCGQRLVLAHNIPNFVHCGDLVKKEALPLGGRGGGSSTSAQVYFPEQEQLAQFRSYLKKALAPPGPEG